MRPVPGSPRRSFTDLASHRSRTQIVEIIAVVMVFNYRKYFAKPLNTPPTR